MPRVVKAAEYAGRRDAILDAAQRLVHTKGYERMTVQDILNALQSSKGALYHYFDSKQALLEALVERMSGEAEALLTPIAHDPHLPALDKLRRFFLALADWKTTRRASMRAMLGVWYADDNAIVRQKARVAMATRVTPLLAVIIQQGVREGVLATPYPDTVAGVAVALVQELSDALGRLLLADEPGRDGRRPVERAVATYTDALERVLGAPSGSLLLADAATLEAWFVAGEDPGEPL